MKTIRAAGVLLLIAALSGCALFWPNGLTVTITPAGAGTVTLDPGRGYYGDGESVTLTAAPTGSYTLKEYRVDGVPTESAGDSLTLVITDDTEVQAIFTDDDLGLLVEPLTQLTEVSIDVGTSPSDVYMIFTNVGTGSEAVPSATRLTGDFGVPPALPRSPPVFAPARPRALRDHPVTRTRDLDQALRAARSRAVSPGVAPPPPMRDTVDVGDLLYDGGIYPTYEPTSVAATCRALFTVDGHTLSIWVADASWEPFGGEITPEMVAAMAAKFLKTGTNNDIYEWVTGIYGEEWGPDAGAGLIPDNDTITIFLYDIDYDSDPWLGGGVVGFFWAKDNFSIYDDSNQRVMFYMDAPMFARVETEWGESGWAITNWWAQEVISTLAHEFQHMIQFYQKSVVAGADVNSHPWLNEMSSMVAEDLVADKVGIPGPRGVDLGLYDDGSAGGTNMGGWLDTYNLANGTELTDWYYADPYDNYAVNYAFGAYLARNFGGAELFRNIVQNSDSGRDAIDTGLSLTGFTDTFDSALRSWAVANLLSDNVGVAPPYLYNDGIWIDASVGDALYQLGSINLYNYGDGPKVTVSTAPSGTVNAASSKYYLVAQGATGLLSWQVQPSADVRLELVVKR